MKKFILLTLLFFSFCKEPQGTPEFQDKCDLVNLNYNTIEFTYLPPKSSNRHTFTIKRFYQKYLLAYKSTYVDDINESAGFIGIEMIKSPEELSGIFCLSSILEKEKITDTFRGADGSTWNVLMNSFSGSYSMKAWTPTAFTEKRELTHLVSFGKAVFQLFGLNVTEIY